MRHSPSSSPAVRVGCLAAVLLASSCSHDAPSAPQRELVQMCQPSGPTGTIVSVAASDLAAARSRGDYAVVLTVSKQAGATLDSMHFSRIGDALAVARAGRLARGEQLSAACAITIAVGPGVFQGDVKDNADATLERFPLVIDVPQIALVGEFKMQVDAGGRALGTSDGGVATTLSPVVPLPIVGGATSQTGASTPVIIVNGHPAGSLGNGATIEGFVFQSGHVGVDTIAGGLGVFSMRVQGLVIRGNRFEAGFTETIDLRASSASVERNHLGGTMSSCDICLSGPGDFQVSNNRLLAGGIPGILMTPTTLLPVSSLVEQYVLPAASAITATVTNNEVRDHLRKPVGVGIRVGAVGFGAPNVAGSARVIASNNTLINNNFGVIVEAAFPVANSVLRGDINLTLSGNVLQQSCQADLLVSLSRHTTALGLNNFPYLRNSSYSLTLGGNVRWDDAWYSHPSGFGNTLSVDGQTIANGARAVYVASRTCQPTSP